MSINTASNKAVSPIAFGTWGVGGCTIWEADGSTRHEPSKMSTDYETEAIKYAIQSGINYIDTCLRYANHHANLIVRDAIKLFDRQELFISAKLDSWHESSDGIYQEIELYLQTLDVDFIDLYQIHHPMVYLSHQETIRVIDRLMDAGLVRSFGVSNFNTEQIREAIYTSQHNLACCEIHYNLLIRANERNGVIDFCNEQGIHLLVYQPLRRGRIASANYPLLKEMSEKYQKTQNQILINWLVHKGFIPIVKSTDISHINENLKAVSFKLTLSDYELLNSFDPSSLEQYDWDYWGSREDKVKIWKL